LTKRLAIDSNWLLSTSLASGGAVVPRQTVRILVSSGESSSVKVWRKLATNCLLPGLNGTELLLLRIFPCGRMMDYSIDLRHGNLSAPILRSHGRRLFLSEQSTGKKTDPSAGNRSRDSDHLVVGTKKFLTS
jgi:hypothetical protein